MSSLAKVCTACRKDITGSAITAGESAWCLTCFKCCECKKALGTAGFVIVNGKPSCASHVLPKCDACSQAIEGPFMEVAELKIHNDCFVCSIVTCKAKLDEDPEANLIDGKFFCGRHADGTPTPTTQSESGASASAGPTSYGNCGVCGEACYGGSSLKAQKQVYHKACFKCAECGELIGEARFVVSGGQISCASHLTLSNCAICGRRIFGNHFVKGEDAYHPGCVEGGTDHINRLPDSATFGDGDNAYSVARSKLTAEASDDEEENNVDTADIRAALTPAHASVSENYNLLKANSGVDTSEDGRRETKDQAKAVAIASKTILTCLGDMIDKETQDSERVNMDGLYKRYERAVGDLAMEIKDFFFADVGADKTRLLHLVSDIKGFADEVMGTFRLCQIRYRVEPL